jgi:hypothetical protein
MFYGAVKNRQVYLSQVTCLRQNTCASNVVAGIFVDVHGVFFDCSLHCLNCDLFDYFD